jgi:hypothetical protein
MLALMDLMPARFADELFDGEGLDLAAADDLPGAGAASSAAEERSTRTVWLPGVMAVCGSAACVAVLVGVMLALHNAAPGPLQSAAETAAQTTQSTADTIENTAAETTADTATGTAEPPQTADSARVTGTVIPETGRTEPSATASETTAQTASAAETTATDIPDSRGADPEAVIEELKAGRQSVFRYSEAVGGYIESWQTYGVAFLCGDPESLRTKQIGGHPVTLAAGTCTPSDDANACTVQRVSDFLRVYGDSGMHPRSPVTDPAAELQRLKAESERDGQTLCMASVGGTDLKFTQASGGTAYDASEIIRAIAADSALTLVGLVWCEEDAVGELPFGEIRILVQFEANCTPDPADYAEYGELEYFVGHWEIVTALENPPADGDRTKIWQALANMCAKLEARPEIRSALPELNYSM